MGALQAWLAEQEDVPVTDTFLAQVGGVSEDLSREIVALNKGAVFEAVGDGYRVLAGWRNDDDLDLSPIVGIGLEKEAILALVRSRHPDERLPRASRRP